MKTYKFYILVILFSLSLGSLSAESEKNEQSTNYILKFSGAYEDSKPLDLALVGIASGDQFSVNLPDPARRVEALVLPLDDGRFSIQYIIGSSLPIKDGDKVVYRDSLLKGKVVVKLGKPIPIIRVGDKTVTLTLERYSE